MTNEERQRQIDLVFLAAVDIPEADRPAFLAERFDHVAPDVIAEVEQLLAMDERATHEHFAANPHLKLRGLVESTAAPVTEAVGDTIGKYQLLQQLGEGGMGVVYMADQKQPVKRRVALKVIKPGMDSKSVVARFEAERQALAMMDHPNIATVLDTGSTESGRPYFVMELVKGVPITKYCDENKVSVNDRLALFESVCQAVHHAHQKGVIHRDLKPSNILVADYDDVAVPKVIDFGLAKALQQPLTEKTLFTQLGHIVGTLEYMSPEQAKLNQLDIDTRTDIYSLGVLLYELLSGHTPFDSQQLRSAAFDEMLRVIREEDPPKPSIRLSTSPESSITAESRKTDPGKLQATVSGDLDAIVMKSLSKERARRYESSSAFAEDIRRYLEGRPVEARPPSVLYLARKTYARHRLAISAAILVLCSLVFGLAGVSYFAHRNFVLAKENKELADNERILRGRADLAAAAEKAARMDAEAARNKEEQARREAEQGKYVSSIHAVSRLLPTGASLGVRDVLDDSPEELRSWEWDYLDGVFAQVESNQKHKYFIQSLACSPDGTWFATVDFFGGLHIWDGQTRQLRKTIAVAEQGDSGRLWVSPNNRQLILLGNGCYAIDVDSAEILELEVPWEHVGVRRKYCSFSPNGDQIMLSAERGFVVFDMRQGQETERGFAPKGTRASRFTPWPNIVVSSGPHPDSRVSGGDGYFLLWDLSDKSTHNEIRVPRHSPESARDIHFGRKGRHYITYDPANFSDVIVWDYKTNEEIWRVETDSNRFSAYSDNYIDFNSDDTQFVIPLDRNGLLVCDIPSKEMVILRGHEGQSRGVSFRTRDEIVSSGLDRRLFFWDSNARPSAYNDWPALNSSTRRFSPAGDRFVTVGSDRSIRIWEFPELSLNRTLQWHKFGLRGDTPRYIAFSPDGGVLATAGRACVRLWDVNSGSLLGSKELSGGALEALVFAPDGKSVLYVLTNGDCRQLDVETLHERQVAEFDQCPFTMSISGSGKWVAAGGLSGRLQLADVSNAKEEPLLIGEHYISIRGICFDETDEHVACCGYDNKVTVYNLASGEETAVLKEQYPILQCRFLPGYKNRLVSTTIDRVVRIWDLKEEMPVLTLDTEAGRFDIDPSGNVLAAVLQNGNIRFWERTRPDAATVNRRRLRKQAMHEVEKRFQETRWASDVRDGLAQADLDARVLADALSYLAARGDDFAGIVDDAWSVLKEADQNQANYRDALRQLNDIGQQVQQSPQYQSLIGMAQVRVGEFDNSVATLQAAKTLLEATPLMPDARYSDGARRNQIVARTKNLAFLILALRKANRHDEADKMLTEFRLRQAENELIVVDAAKVVEESEIVKQSDR